jgi:hypothetical protein
VHLDPASTIIHDLVKAGTGTSPENARVAFAAAFGFTPDPSVAPRNTPYSASSTTPQRLAGLRAAAFSQMTKDLGLSPEKQFELVAAMAQDLADDGALNGSAGQVNGSPLPEDIQNRFERALVSFQSNTTCNQTGLLADQIGMLPFAKISLTNTYRVEYLPGMMPATQGKTTFRIRITNRSDGSPAPGLAVSLMPLMYMSTKNHTTPVDSVFDNGDGTYTCTVYYLMSSMMNGMSLGFWELKVTIGGMGGETARFYPNVGMAMGSTTVRAALKGQSDMILSSPTGTTTEKRSYFLFRDGLTGMTGNHTFSLFIAAKESMMSFPAVSVGTTLHDQTSASWTVNTMIVEASTDGSSWTAGTDNSGGRWSIPGLTGLVSGNTGTIYVRTMVNGEQKTTDGNAPSGANGYGTFTVIPGM